MISRWLRRHLGRERDSEQTTRAVEPVWRPAVQFDPAVQPISWWRAL